MPPRKKKLDSSQPAQEVIPTGGEPGSEVQHPATAPEGDDPALEFDPANLETLSPTTSVESTETVRQFQPDPFPMEAVSLGREKDAPKMRLFRSNRYRQLAIQFDEKPDARYTQMLTEAGFRWRANEGVWTRQLDTESKWKSQADAERLFRQIANGIRTDLGLEAVQAVGV